jgi:hypothetical protein
MPTAPISLLPESVSPGDLITADMFNAMLEALRKAQSSDERFTNLTQEITNLKAQVKRSEDLIDSLTSNGNELRGRVDRLFVDRDDILFKLGDLQVTVIPGIRTHVDQIESRFVERLEPIDRRMTDVELRLVNPSDPIERLPGLTAEHITRLHSSGILNVSDLRAHAAEIPGIIGNDLDALRITNMLERIR